MQGEAIAGTAGHQREGGRRVDQRLGDLVHRAIAADGDDMRAASRDRLAAELRGMPRTLGHGDLGVEAVGGDEVADIGGEIGPTSIASGGGIDDEAGLHAVDAMNRGSEETAPGCIGTGMGSWPGAVLASRCIAMSRAASGRASPLSDVRHWFHTRP